MDTKGFVAVKLGTAHGDEMPTGEVEMTVNSLVMSELVGISVD